MLLRAVDRLMYVRIGFLSRQRKADNTQHNMFNFAFSARPYYGLALKAKLKFHNLLKVSLNINALNPLNSTEINISTAPDFSH